MADGMKRQYRAPQADFCEAGYLLAIAGSPTGEDYTEPEEYNGF